MREISDRVFEKPLKTAEQCFNQAIKLSKTQPLVKRLDVRAYGACGPVGHYTVIKYSFVEWQFGSLTSFEWPIKGKVNALTEGNVEGFNDGNQVFDGDRYLIHTD